MRSYKARRAALSGVSDEIGVANASTRMCWPGFLWSKDSETKSEWLRARLNRFISREPKATHTGCPFLGYFFLCQKEVSRALTRN